MDRRPKKPKEPAKVKAAPGGVRLTSGGESRQAGAAPFRLAEGGRRSGTQSEGLSSLHTLTRSSKEHLRSGRDRKTAGFMVTVGSGGGGWDWTGLGKGCAPGAGDSGTSSSRPGAPAANTRDNFQRGLSRPHFRVLPTSEHFGKCSPILLSLTTSSESWNSPSQ